MLFRRQAFAYVTNFTQFQGVGFRGYQVLSQITHISGIVDAFRTVIEFLLVICNADFDIAIQSVGIQGYIIVAFMRIIHDKCILAVTNVFVRPS